MRKAITKILTTEETEVIDTASNGQEGIEKALLLNPDVITMDIEMPIMNGFDATKLLRSKGDFTPIIALTGHGKALQQQCIDAGMNYFLTKPIDIHKLQSILSNITTFRSNGVTTPLPNKMLNNSSRSIPSPKKQSIEEWGEF